MHQLRPSETFPIRRQLDDPTDVGTYYMRAVLRWADDGSLIPINGLNYANMVDEGSQRFRANIQVPADKAGGLGSYLIITTTVYTDSGYTTVADNYRIEEQTYLVFDRQNPYVGMGGGSGVNYETIERIVRDNVVAHKQEMQKVDLNPVLQSLEALKSAVLAIEMPETEKVSFDSVLERIGQAEASTKEAISAIRIPEPEKLDLSPVTSILEKIDPENFHSKMDGLFTKIKGFLGDDMDNIKDGIERIEKGLGLGNKFMAMLRAGLKGGDGSDKDEESEANEPTDA